MTPELWMLVGVVALSFTVEATIGFGATIIALTLGAFLLPVDELLPAFVPLNLALSSYIAYRYRDAIDWRLLLHKTVPWMAVGLPLGMAAVLIMDGGVLRHIFGVFVVGLCLLELGRMMRANQAATRPMNRGVGYALLVLGGLVHGAFATGGPMAVYVTGRELTDKQQFRATLSLLWLILNLVLMITFAAGGRVGAASGKMTALFILPLVVGLIAGEWAHRRVAPIPFRYTVFGGLLIAGGVLIVN